MSFKERAMKAIRIHNYGDPSVLLGANELIDYRFEDLSSRARDVDVILETLRSGTQEKSWGALHKDGVSVSVVGLADESNATSTVPIGPIGTYDWMAANDAAMLLRSVKKTLRLPSRSLPGPGRRATPSVQRHPFPYFARLVEQFEEGSDSAGSVTTKEYIAALLRDIGQHCRSDFRQPATSGA
jgi:hypothetical protein